MNVFRFSMQPVQRVEQTSNLIINLDHDEWILEDDTLTLVEREFGQWHFPMMPFYTHRKSENETEVSFFNLNEYEAFKLNPEARHTYICLSFLT